MRTRALAAALRQPEPELHRCGVMRCNRVLTGAQAREDEEELPTPRPFCRDHWNFLKPWQRAAICNTFAGKEWDAYFEIVRQCADHLDTLEDRARDHGFQGLVLARYFEPGCTSGRGRLYRMMGKRL